MKKPRSWHEASQHPGICEISYEKPHGPWDLDAPWLITLNEGWSFNEDMTITYVANFRDFLSLWDDIVNLPSEHG